MQKGTRFNRTERNWSRLERRRRVERMRVSLSKQRQFKWETIPNLEMVNWIVIGHGLKNQTVSNYWRRFTLKIRVGNLAIIFQQWVKQQLFSKSWVVWPFISKKKPERASKSGWPPGWLYQHQLVSRSFKIIDFSEYDWSKIQGKQTKTSFSTTVDHKTSRLNGGPWGLTHG